MSGRNPTSVRNSSFRLGQSAAVNVLKDMMRLDENRRAAILSLPNRFTVVSRPDVASPFLTRVPGVY
jgi:hypothetical protein